MLSRFGGASASMNFDILFVARATCAQTRCTSVASIMRCVPGSLRKPTVLRATAGAGSLMSKLLFCFLGLAIVLAVLLRYGELLQSI